MMQSCKAHLQLKRKTYIFALFLGLCSLMSCGESDSPSPTGMPEPSQKAPPKQERAALALNVIDNVADHSSKPDAIEDTSSKIDSQIHHLTDLMLASNGQSITELESIVASTFVGTHLIPADLESTYQSGGIHVQRMGTPDRDHSLSGTGGLSKAIQDWLAITGTKHLRFKFKTVHINVESTTHIRTTHLVAVTGQTDRQTIEQNATWQAKWSHPENETALPRLLEITVAEFEQVSIDSDQPIFADVTGRVLVNASEARQQFAVGAPDRCRQIEKFNRIYIEAHNGITIGDVNGDGLDDLYRCQQGGLPNRLFIRRADGGADDASARSGLDFLDNTDSALLIDLDNDGDQDFVLSLERNILFMENDGSGHFIKRHVIDLSFGMSMAAADYDNDGDLDLYVCVYAGGEEFDRRASMPLPYHDATNGERNILFRNEGNWVFKDVTSDVGLDSNNTKYSFAAVWDDYDDDGDLDLHVANDFGRNNLYQNDNGHFTDVAARAGTEDGAFGMSLTIGDYNRDGHNDVYISNMFSSAGNRVTYQRHFKASAQATTVQQFQRMARGNSLFEYAGNGKYSDVSMASGTTIGRWAWGSLFTDLNNDGWEDLIVANGYVTGVQKDDL